MLYYLNLRLFKYITFRTAYAAIFSFLLVLILGSLIIKWLKSLNLKQTVREDGPKRHFGKSETPTMGGLLILLSILSSCFLWIKLNNTYFLIVLFATVSFSAIGFFDDFLKISRKNSDGLKARLKILFQFIFSFLIMLFLYNYGGKEITKIYFPFIKNFYLDLGILYIPFGMLVLIATSNSFNLTDGLDGLATGLSLIVMSAFIFIAYLTSRYDFAHYLNIPYIEKTEELVVYGGAFLGALLGFLWYNAHPAKIMMGDTGSLFIGAVLGTYALILKSEILFIILGGVFVLESLSVILQVFWFKRTGRRIFKMAPIHHHFEEKGWSETQVVIRFWILGLIFAIFALSTLKIR